jgi:hypothetical protein
MFLVYCTLSSYIQFSSVYLKFVLYLHTEDILCGLVVRLSAYRSRGPGFDSLPYQFF